MENVPSASHQVAKKRIIYLHPQIDRIGQLVCEPFYLRNIYPASHYDITLVTPTLDRAPKTNKPLFQIVTRNFDLVQTSDMDIVGFTHANRNHPTTEVDGEIHFLEGIRVIRAFVASLARGEQPWFYYQLAAEELERGKELRAKLGIPLNAEIVTMHVREGGYLPSLSYHSYRDNNIESYIPALEYLVQRGYYVIRLGDSTMKPLPFRSPRVIDAPLRPDYDSFFDPYFISQSKFLLGSDSGPTVVAQCFGVPVLITNIPIQRGTLPMPNNLLLPKKYFAHALGQNLSLRQIIETGIVDLYRTEAFQEVGVEVRSNTPNELLHAAQEMVERLEGTYRQKTDADSLDQMIFEMLGELHQRRQASDPSTVLNYAEVQPHFCHSYFESEPDFFRA